jgi:hypothetical protein
MGAGQQTYCGEFGFPLAGNANAGVFESPSRAGGYNLFISALQTPRPSPSVPRLRGGPDEVSLADHDFLFLDRRS